MTSNESLRRQGTQYPVYHEGKEDSDADVSIRTRYFTIETEEGVEAGASINVMFTIDRPAREVWPYFKDWNLWMNDYGHYWSGVVGDLEGGTFSVGSAKGEYGPNRYNVIRAIPEHLLVFNQPVPDDGSTGGVSPGFHVFTLNERREQTIITGYMQHSSRTTGNSVEKALAFWREQASEWQRKWRDALIPALKKLVYEGK